MTEFESEEQAEARVRAVRCRVALRAAPETAARLRSRAIPADGRTERGSGGERVPLLTAVADAADELVVILQSWVDDFAEQMGEPGPQAVGWRNGQTARMLADRRAEFSPTDPLGFRAGTTRERASILVSKLASWLAWHEDKIAGLAGAVDYQVEVAELIWSNRWRAGMDTPRVREASRRACPTCGHEVVVSFFGEPFASAERRGEFSHPSNAAERRDPKHPAGRRLLDLLEGIHVDCGTCGWTPPTHPATLARWVEGDRSDRPGHETAPFAECSGEQRVIVSDAEPERRARLAFTEWWTLTDAAFMLGRDKATLTRWADAGMPVEKSTVAGIRRVRVRRSDAHRWLENPNRRTRRKAG